MKGQIFYDKITKKLVTSLCLHKRQCGVNENFILINEKDWLDFLDKNQGKEFFYIDGNLVAKDIEISIEDLRNSLIGVRKSFLIKTGYEYSDDWDSCPQEIKNKRTQARNNNALILVCEDLAILESIKNNNSVYDY